MASGVAQTDQSSAPGGARTIWQGLTAWSKQLASWQQSIVAHAIAGRRLSDAQIERKFKELADGILTPAAVQQVIDEVWKFERCSDIGAFVQLTEAI